MHFFQWRIISIIFIGQVCLSSLLQAGMLAECESLLRKTRAQDKELVRNFSSWLHQPRIQDENKIREKVRLYQQGDKTVSGEIVGSLGIILLRNVLTFARSEKVSVADLLNEAILGVLLATKNFDFRQDVKFRTFALKSANDTILKFLNGEFYLVRRPRFSSTIKESGDSKNQMIRRILDRLSKEHSIQTVVDIDRIAHETSTTRELVEEALVLSNYSEVEGGDFWDRNALTEGELVSKLAHSDLEKAMIEFKNSLDERELAIFQERILSDDPLTLAELGKKFDRTGERFRTIEKELIVKLKKFLENRFKLSAKSILTLEDQAVGTENTYNSYLRP